MKVLDVGCGRVPKGDVNVDLFTHDLQRAKKGTITSKTVPNFVLAHAEFLPFRDHSFKVVYCSHTLEHCLNPFLVLKEFHRVSNSIVFLHIPDGARTSDDSEYHFYSWTFNSFKHLLSQIFPQVECYATERTIHQFRGGRWQYTLFGDVFLVLFRKLRNMLFKRTQITAICHKKRWRTQIEEAVF